MAVLSQGIVFKFEGKGKIYEFDLIFAVTQFTNLSVLLGLGTIITVFLAKVSERTSNPCPIAS